MRLWPTVVLSVTSVLLFAGASLAETGLVASSGTVAGPLSAFGSGGAVSNSHIKSALSGSDCASGWTFFWTFCLPQIGLPSGLTCFLPIPLPIVVNEAIFGPGCGVIPSSEVAAVNLANAHVAAQNLMTTLFNYLNVTNSGTANVNATFQELLSYYESRAEAIIPYFVGQPWNQTMYDFIATLSGLVPSLEGIEGSFASQQYQDWNATAAGWDIAFGSGGTFDATTAQWDINETGTFSGNFPVAFNGYDVNVTRPYEDRTTYASGGTGGPTIYFNMAPGGTIVDANYAKQSGTGWQGNFTVFDLTQGTHFFVPSESYGNWANGTIPLEAKLHNVSQFDLLKMVCNTNCSSSTLETDFAYAFENNTNLPLGSQNQNTMIPMVNVLNPAAGIYWPVPSTRFNTCIAFSGPGNPPCDTSVTATGGNSIELSSGPGQAIGGNKTFLAFAETAQSLVNNTMTMAYDYWLTLRAITENGTYAIPPNCAIPTPSDAFPSATDYTNYKLSANDVEAVYLAYLNAVAREYGQVFTNQVNFCGNPNLGFSFNWSGSWKLLLNITASVYIGTNQTPLELNGTPNANISYSNVATWPAYNVDPALLYPYEYQMNVPVGKVYPIPLNNPLVAVLVKYPGNLYYGNAAFTPAWGVPTYASLTGNGNLSFVSGNLSTIQSGRFPSQGDAIEINSCVLNGIPQNPCDISVTYFNNFTIGLVHAVIPPVIIVPPGTLGGLGNNCGFGVLDQFYDGWAGDIGSAIADGFAHIAQAVNGIPIIGGGISYLINGLGCIIAWIVIILILVLIAYIVYRIVLSVYHGARRSRSTGENVS